MNQPKISVVTVCYNAESCLEKTILSVINQTYPNIEYIIIDGASIDGTMGIVNKYKDKIDVIVSEPDKGIYDAMNKGLDKASGVFINFMNAGDTFASIDVVKKIFDYEYLGKNVKLIFGPWYLVYNGHERLITPSPFFKNTNKVRGMGFSHQTVFLDLSLAKKYKFNNNNFKIAADYNMISSIYRSEDVQTFEIAFPIAKMDDSDGATINNFRLHLLEDAKICGFDNYYGPLQLKLLLLAQRVKRLIKHLIYSL